MQEERIIRFELGHNLCPCRRSKINSFTLKNVLYCVRTWRDFLNMGDVFLKLKASSSVLIRYFNSYFLEGKKKGETCKKNWILESMVVYNSSKNRA